MKKILSILAVAVLPSLSFAQDSGVESELDQALNAEVEAETASQPQQVVQSQVVQPTIVLRPAPQVVQKQATTYVQDTPLRESKAEQIRKSRQDAEVETENRIVEKLEQSRMEDEKKRANVLFGDKFNQLNQSQTDSSDVRNSQSNSGSTVQQPVVVLQQTAPEKDDTRDLIREELRAAKLTEEEFKPEPVQSKYMAVLVGMADFPDAKNVQGNASLGVAFGTKYDDTLIVEGTFNYSSFQVEQFNDYVMPSNYWINASANNYYGSHLVDVNQYSGALAAKVQMFSGLVKPVVGGVMQYSYRTYAWAEDYLNVSDETANSYALDVGLLGGVDLEFSPKFTLGFDYRYMFNMANKSSGASRTSYYYAPTVGTPLDKLQYWTLSLVGRVSF